MRVSRFDSYPISFADKISKNGFLTLPAIITKAGVFSYKQSDGSVIRELRHPDEVFRADSLSSLKGIPLVTEQDHLRCLCDGTPVNKISEFTQLGALGSRTDRNSKDELESDITIYNPDTIKKIDSNEARELSAGYTLKVVEESGTYKGERYDQKQTNIVYGHVAVVKRGRAGTAGFRIDSQAAIQSTETETKKEDSVDKTIIKKEIPALTIGKGDHGFRLDSLSVEENDGVLSLLAQRNTLISECEKAQARADRADGETTQLKADKERLETELKASIPTSRLDSEIKEGTELLKMCEELRIDTEKSKTNIDRKRAICKAVNPSLDEKRLDGDFMEGVFCNIKSDWEQKVKNNQTLEGLESSFSGNQEGQTPISYTPKA